MRTQSSSKSAVFLLGLWSLTVATAFAGGAIPEITGVSGNFPTQGGTTITVSGSGFSGSSQSVSFGITDLTPTVNSDNEFTFDLPDGLGTVALVFNNGSANSNPFNVTYDAPTISSIDFTAAEGETFGGGEIEIIGTNFGNETLDINFDNNSIGSFSPTSHTSVTFTLPEGEGTGIPVNITVGGQTSNNSSFSYTPPAITLLTPAKGLASLTSPITITGTSFGLSPAVTIGGIPVTATANDHNSFTFDKPTDSGGDLDIVVTTAGQSSNASPFRSVNLTSLPGYYVDLDTETVVAAPAGSFVAVANATEPTPAPEGFFTPFPGMQAAIPAARGHYVPDPGMTTQLTAGPGFYVDLAGQSEAKAADLGTFAPIPGLHAAIPAAKGYYVPDSESTSQTPAPPGSFTASEGSSTSEPAGYGFFTPVDGMQAKIPASKGYYVPSPNASSQTPADPGNFVGSEAQSTQQQTPVGRYSPAPGMQAGILASKGYFVDSPGSSTQSPAPLGRFSASEGATTATQASAGRYAPVEGMHAAIDASPGYYVPFSGLSGQTPADIGRYVPVAGSTTQIDAPVGSYAPIEALRAPIPAPPGTYSPNLGSSTVQVIPPGFTSEDGGISITPQAQIQIVAYTLEANGDNTITFDTNDGQNYGIFYSENLIDYTLLETVAGTPTTVTRTITPPASSTGKRFFVVSPVATP